jgi:hypothetical protein
MKAPQVGPFAAGNDEKIDVAVMRPTTNLREAENLGEATAGEVRRNQQPFRFSKHGTFGPQSMTHPGLD